MLPQKFGAFPLHKTCARAVGAHFYRQDKNRLITAYASCQILLFKKRGKCVLHVLCGAQRDNAQKKIDSLFARWNHFLIDSSP